VSRLRSAEVTSRVQPWHARVVRADGTVVGAGVLVDRWHILTCTQAAETAGAVDFPGWPEGVAPSGSAIEVEVPPYGHGEEDPQRRSEVRLLRLSRPAPVELVPATLTRCATGDRRRVRLTALGAAAGAADVGAADVVRLEGVLDSDGAFLTAASDLDPLSVDPPSVAGQPRTEVVAAPGSGLIGTAAMDPQTDSVVGVVVEAGRGLRVVRTDALMVALPYLAPLLDGEVVIPAPPAHPRRPKIPEREVDDEDLRRLFALLWVVPGMADPVARAYYAAALSQGLGAQFVRGPGGDDVLDVWALAVDLLECPGGVRQLAELLRRMHPGHPSVIRFEEHVDLAYPDLLLLPSERVALEGHLVGVDWGKVGRAYRDATRYLGALPTRQPATVGKVIRDLESRGSVLVGASRERVPVALVFVEHVAHAIGGRLGTELHGWLGTVADRFALPRAARHEVCDEATRQRSTPPLAHLVVVLEPDGMDPDRFLLSAVVMSDDEPERSLFRDDTVRTLAEVEQTLDEEILSRFPDTVGGQAGAVLEIVLPHRLLGTPVEAWTVDRRGTPQLLGMRYPVVVRSLERMVDPAMRGAWERATERLHRFATRPEAGGALHHVTSGVGASQSDDETPGEREPTLAETVVLTVPFPPDGNGDPVLFTAWIRSGVPVIIWSREPVDPVGFGGSVRRDFLVRGPVGIPGLVHAWRRAQGSGRPPVGILYDEANRVPSHLRRHFRLRPPGPGTGAGPP
jgi:hypothetical protein